MNNNQFWSKKIAAQYDSLYASDTYHRGVKPLEPVQLLTRKPQRGRVLDVGGGEGRHALFLARQGFKVDVIDLSMVGLQKIQNIANEEKLPIETSCADIKKIELVNQYDVVIVSFVMHHFLAADAIRVFDSIKNATLPGGTHVVAGFINEGELYERAKKSSRFYPSMEQLTSIYAGWTVVAAQEKQTTTMARDKTGQRLKNQMIEFAVQKPSATKQE